MIKRHFDHLNPTEKAELFLAAQLAASRDGEIVRSWAKAGAPDEDLEIRRAAAFRTFCQAEKLDAATVLGPGDQHDVFALRHRLALEIAVDPTAIKEVQRLAKSTGSTEATAAFLRGYAQVARRLPSGGEETDGYRAARNAIDVATGREKALLPVIAGSPADLAQALVLRRGTGLAAMSEHDLDELASRIAVSSIQGSAAAGRGSAQAPNTPEKLSPKDVRNLARFGMKETGHSLTPSIVRSIGRGDYVAADAFARIDKENEARAAKGMPAVQFRAASRDNAFAELQNEVEASQGGPRPARTSAPQEPPAVRAQAVAIGMMRYLRGEVAYPPNYAIDVMRNGKLTRDFAGDIERRTAQAVVEQVMRDPWRLKSMTEQDIKRGAAILASNISRNPNLGSEGGVATRTLALPDKLSALRDNVKAATGPVNKPAPAPLPSTQAELGSKAPSPRASISPSSPPQAVQLEDGLERRQSFLDRMRGARDWVIARASLGRQQPADRRPTGTVPQGQDRSTRPAMVMSPDFSRP